MVSGVCSELGGMFKWAANAGSQTQACRKCLKEPKPQISKDDPPGKF